ncbi:acetyl-coenzyme A carboxylase carboxyl transferase subunit alpha, chloroplastic-like protein isoform X1, partial [Tanacetum coccineum]
PPLEYTTLHHYWGALFWYEERVKALPKGAAPQAMSGLKVPITIAVAGEGGSNAALAIGCANKLFMLENIAFYVAIYHFVAIFI